MLSRLDKDRLLLHWVQAERSCCMRPTKPAQQCGKQQIGNTQLAARAQVHTIKHSTTCRYKAPGQLMVLNGGADSCDSCRQHCPHLYVGCIHAVQAARDGSNRQQAPLQVRCEGVLLLLLLLLLL
jgi:hypothetical protein